jgi:MerR family transcriptional regulator, light-induced transcriptional regulator
MSDPLSTNVPRYRIGAVARATGINAETLRIWERRYGLLSPSRSDGGGRLYTDADVTRLRLIKQLLDRGHAIGRVALLEEAELRETLTRLEPEGRPSPNVGLDPLRARFMDMVLRLDVGEAHAFLGRAALMLDTRALVLELLVPALRDIGDRWEAGSARVCHEHAASGIIRSVLGTLLANQPRNPGVRRLVLGTLTGELHEFGALLAAVLAAGSGWRVTYLGPNLPADEFLAAAAAVGAQAVAVSALHVPSPQALTEAEALVSGLPSQLALIAGGARARDLPPLTRRALLLDDLGSFGAWLEQGSWADAHP